ncbi:PREDICTED: pentatricopeptide repeat-containing protein At1g80270, mitochondrial-like [Nicotiana attenuata]|uniref:Pentatricopeptide repeat-containing protein, mitochondrial n=1 Tax=Nicotiana attenuata TaxID=49451 RepID=A0A314LA61_NICAT|nr:PREDICTED: pentatricopeptide repeat-containing protein At1g80270, mitochondrial-like [Nicotiana attenuata]OIT37949.1 pentatricopeptide repeat-containing protein, mitochondrial [Nicotiana attenuata]
MWAIRRASPSFKKQVFTAGHSRICSATSEISSQCLKGYGDGFKKASNVISDRPLGFRGFRGITHGFLRLFTENRSFSSLAGTKSSGEEDSDSDDGFSELESSTEAIQEANKDVESVSEHELSEDDVDGEDVEAPRELELSDTETDVSKRKSPRKRVSSALYNAIVAAPALSVHKIMDKWVEEGNDVTRAEVAAAMLNLRKRRMYGRALQLSEWLESKKNLTFTDRDYASRVDLIAKVRGLQKAEDYIGMIPKSFRGEVIYRTLLANCVAECNLKKSEKIFNKMKDLELPLTCFACNQLLLLYKRTDKKKIADVLLLMEKENVKPSLFTYRTLIDAKGQCNDISGMEQIVETMKAEGIEPDINTKSILAKHYVSGGLNEKAENVLKEMEGGDIKENRWACRSLLPLYAALGKADEVGRIWQVCESNPRLDECVAAVEAWGKLHNIKEAEAVFDKMAAKWATLSSKHYSVLLRIYASHKMLSKGKDLVKRMSDSGCRIGPLTWDALVRLYVEAGEVEKADSILHKAAEQNRLRPMINSYLVIMEQYAKRGDVHNTEKMFHRMRQAGYVSRISQYQCLIRAYINAKAPCYGIAERMKADSVFPNKGLAHMLAQVDAFKKTAVSDLLD